MKQDSLHSFIQMDNVRGLLHLSTLCVEQLIRLCISAGSLALSLIKCMLSIITQKMLHYTIKHIHQDCAKTYLTHLVCGFRFYDFAQVTGSDIAGVVGGFGIFLISFFLIIQSIPHAK